MNWLLVAGFFFYVIVVTGFKQIDKVFNQACLESIVNQTRSQMCPSSIRNSFFNWKNEIFHRKVAYQSSGNLNMDMDEPTVPFSFNENKNNKGASPFFLHENNNLSANKTFFSIYSFNSKLTTIEDIYLLLISVSLVCFFISLIIPLVLIKSNKQSKKILKSSMSSSSLNLSEINELKKKQFLISTSDLNVVQEASDSSIAGFSTPKIKSKVFRLFYLDK
jgi:hypothetical protein